jgi:hypothetical protein
VDKISAVYYPNDKIQKDPVKCQQWLEHLEGRFTLADWLGSSFEYISPHLHTRAKQQVHKLNVPTLAQISDQADDQGFCGNLTYTTGNFYCVPHRDNDISETTLFFSLPIHNNGKITLLQDGYDVSEGSLYFPDHKFSIQLNSPNKMCWVVYYGNRDRHCTLKSVEKGGNFTRLSASCQISKTLAERVKTHLESGDKSVGTPKYLCERFQEKIDAERQKLML